VGRAEGGDGGDAWAGQRAAMAAMRERSGSAGVLYVGDSVELLWRQEITLCVRQR
jgi:hypothetical protein